MLGKLLQPDIADLIERRDLDTLRRALVGIPPEQLAEIVTDLPGDDAAVAFRVLPRGLAADVFAWLPHDSQTALLRSLSCENVASILNEMPPDDRTQLLEELPGTVTQQLLGLLTPAERKVAQTLLGYPENSVGRLMTPDLIAVRPTWTIDEAFRHIREKGIESETINVIYVVDESMRLLDDLKLRQLVLAAPSQRIESIMDYNFITLQASDDQETAVQTFKKYGRVALPVTDTAGILLGIVTVDDVLRVAEEEATEDIHKLGGSQALDLPYLSTRLPVLIRKRIGWLAALFIGETLTATTMGYYEEEISRAVVLALFVPLIISSGGNSGSQAATLIIRALALGEVTLRDWWRVIYREIIAGISLGAMLGAIGFARIALWSTFTDIYGPHWLLVALTVWAALIGVVLWGTLAGALMPLLMKHIGADPAVSSAPFVATLVDVTGLIIYFSVAAFILHGVLL